MATTDLKPKLVLSDFENLSLAHQAITEIALSNGLSDTQRLQWILLISRNAMHCAPYLDDYFYGDEES